MIPGNGSVDEAPAWASAAQGPTWIKDWPDTGRTGSCVDGTEGADLVHLAEVLTAAWLLLTAWRSNWGEVVASIASAAAG